MKKIMSLLFAFVFLLGCTACGEEKEEEKVDSYLEPVETYYDWLNGKNLTEKSVKSMFPAEVLEYYSYSEDLDGAVANIEDAQRDLVEYCEEEYGADIKFSYKISEKKEMEEDELDDMKDSMKDLYGIPKKNVSKAYELEIEITIEGDEDKDSEEGDFYVVNIDGNWYCWNAFSLLQV